MSDLMLDDWLTLPEKERLAVLDAELRQEPWTFVQVDDETFRLAKATCTMHGAAAHYGLEAAKKGKHVYLYLCPACDCPLIIPPFQHRQGKMRFCNRRCHIEWMRNPELSKQLIYEWVAAPTDQPREEAPHE